MDQSGQDAQHQAARTQPSHGQNGQLALSTAPTHNNSTGGAPSSFPTDGQAQSASHAQPVSQDPAHDKRRRRRKKKNPPVTNTTTAASTSQYVDSGGYAPPLQAQPVPSRSPTSAALPGNHGYQVPSSGSLPSLQALAHALPTQPATGVANDSVYNGSSPHQNHMAFPGIHGYQPALPTAFQQAPAGLPPNVPHTGNYTSNSVPAAPQGHSNSGYTGPPNAPGPYYPFGRFPLNPYANLNGNQYFSYASAFGNPQNHPDAYNGSVSNPYTAYPGYIPNFGGNTAYASGTPLPPWFGHQPALNIHGGPPVALPHPNIAPRIHGSDATPPANYSGSDSHNTQSVPLSHDIPAASVPQVSSVRRRTRFDLVAAPAPASLAAPRQQASRPNDQEAVTPSQLPMPPWTIEGLQEIITSKVVSESEAERRSTREAKRLLIKSQRLALPVPKPSIEYIRLANEKAVTQDPPPRKLVILDLNGTLVYRAGKTRNQVIARACLKPFMRYLLKNFSVMVWSTATPHNVTKTVNKLLNPPTASKLIGVWTREQFGLNPQQYANKVQVYKNLDIVWANSALQRQAPPGGWNQSNTILIDDTAEKAVAQPHNHVELKEFDGVAGEDWTLRSVAAYLEAARKQNNVSAFMREKPYKATAGEWMADWEDEWEESIAMEVVKPLEL